MLETQGCVHYNLRVSNGRLSGHLVLALVMAPLLMGGACEKKSTTPSDPGAIGAIDRAGSGSSGTVEGPVDTTPLPGIELGKLDSDKQKTFYKLLGTLSSPCGKAHSLRTSFSSDQTCKRAPFAVRYLVALLEDAENEGQARELWEKKYKGTSEAFKFDLAKEPRIGNPDAPIRIVEFYDYGCPHCREFAPMLVHMLDDEKGKVVVYFMHFTLGHFANSKEAAQAALAADAQHKFKEMHELLFEHQTEHDHDQLWGYAKQLGLDMAKFEADYNAAAPHVEQQHAQGTAAGVQSTPTLYFNDKKYEGPMSVKYLEMSIDEEIAVNR
jgi:protein-disulfide isomerase